MESLISVIIPVYNVEKYLRRCIESIINQSYRNLEIILVDDGSTDSSGEICDEYAQEDKRIKVVHKKHSGVSDARNIGINNAQGDYLSFIDSDDVISLIFYAKLLNGFGNEGVDISACQYIRFADEGIIQVEMGQAGYVIWDQMKVLHEMTQTGEGSRSEFVSILCNKLFKAELFKNVKFPHGQIHEDEYAISFVLKKMHKMYVCREILYYYRQHFESITGERHKNDEGHIYVIDAFETRCEIFREDRFASIYPEIVCSMLSIMIFIYIRKFGGIQKDAEKQKNILRRYRRNLIRYRRSVRYPKIKYYLCFALSPKLFSFKYNYK